ncbi:stage V sporulation protein AA [Lederbergia wuyishanensis]|uniref:Stage V sporulation protein AA n=1 Tax=Lederbergia wuyishanensis TaxID=1347903 RepID=A0ABU0D132_9BACI|nr:stage V sporulation protein AA [Lederbergia wuyishanensis]MCJ8006728.1 stage V sporulation protein AA [Lederbergia wuyishanensis]MDQ0342110.1 stage V sporulation protein AA [Lederbergia wuyishanensis]
MVSTIYIRMRSRVETKECNKILLSHTSQILAPDRYLPLLHNLVVYELKKDDNQLVVLDVMRIIHIISRHFPDCEVQTIGPTQTIIEIIKEKKIKIWPFFIFVWILLFTGSGLAILNFHEEVSMQAVHQKLYWIITGKEVEKPLLLQIPYSFGIGMGMILFFNHIFKKRFNEEPSPLEIEMFNYQQDLDNYVSVKENNESVKRLDVD